MLRGEFRQLLESLPGLSPYQLRQLTESVTQLSRQNEVRELVAVKVLEHRHCPHCGASKFCRRGVTGAGEQRYQCNACSKSFTGLTGTGISRLHNKERLLDFAVCMKDGLSVRASAAKLGLSRTAMFRWRHRLLPKLSMHQPQALAGVAEADETYFRQSYKGQRKGLPRAAYKRATPAAKRGLSAEQVPVLTALSRGSRHSHITVLSGPTSAKALVAALGPVVTPDTVLCSDSAFAYKPASKVLGVTLRQIPTGSHKLGPYHIQNVNALHGRIKGFFRPFKGVASKNLEGYLAWFRYFDEDETGKSAKQFLGAALEDQRPLLEKTEISEETTTN